MAAQETKTELKDRVAKGLSYGMEALEEVLLADSKLYNDLILLKSKYADLLHLSALQTIPYADLEVGMDRLRHSLLQFIDRLEEGDLKKAHVEQGLKNTSPPNVRGNFFSLISIYRENLEAITYEEQYYGSGSSNLETRVYKGRAAIGNIFQNLVRYARQQDVTSQEAVEDHFSTYFRRDFGPIEVYLKSVKHLIYYIHPLEFDRSFYLTTFQSLLSRFELGLLFYHLLVEKDEQFLQMINELGVFEGPLAEVLIHKDHLDWLR